MLCGLYLSGDFMVFYKDMKKQNWLLPPNIEDIINDDHVCYIVDTIIDNMDLSEIEKEYEGPGHPAYHPRTLVKIIIMGIIDGIRASRKLHKNLRENIVYMYLTGKLKPDFRTISDFRKDNQELIDKCFKEVVKFARDLGMVQLGHISIDGSKFKANASKSKIFTKDELSFLDDFIKNELQKGIEEDEKEDEFYGKDKNGYELPDDLKSYNNIKEYLRKKLEDSKIHKNAKKRIKKTVKDYIESDTSKKELIDNKIKKAMNELENSNSETVNLTDPQSRLMKNKKGIKESGYNGQIAVDSKEKIIIAADVSQSAGDNNELKPMIKNIEDTVGELKEGTEMSLDSGYYSGSNLKHLFEDKKIDGYIPDSKQAQKMKGKGIEKKPYYKEYFEYDDKNDQFICPNGEILIFKYEYYDKHNKRMVREYHCYNCGNCPFKLQCITEKRKNFKRIKIDEYEKYRRRMKNKMNTECGQEKYKIRSKIVEHPFGDIKENIGFRGFLTRGKSNVKTEFKLACIAHNIKRIASFIREKYSYAKNYMKIVRVKSTYC